MFSAIYNCRLKFVQIICCILLAQKGIQFPAFPQEYFLPCQLAFIMFHFFRAHTEKNKFVDQQQARKSSTSVTIFELFNKELEITFLLADSLL